MCARLRTAPWGEKQKQEEFHRRRPGFLYLLNPNLLTVVTEEETLRLLRCHVSEEVFFSPPISSREPASGPGPVFQTVSSSL